MYKRILTIQDISCVGQCSLTVALPILSVCGLETAVLPGSILSNHTAPGFHGWTFHDLTEEMPKILNQWQLEKIDFDAFYTGYVSEGQIPHIIEIMDKTAKPDALRIVDPAMADNGKLYAGFDANFPKQMRKLVSKADYILPNLTEASLLLDIPFIEEGYAEGYIQQIVKGLTELGAKNVILTGVSFEKEKLGVAIYDGCSLEYYFTNRVAAMKHGTGDIYASVFAGLILGENSIQRAAAVAHDFVVEALKASLDDKEHWYGAKFEKAIPFLVKEITK